MPISAEQWRLAVGRANASRSLRPRVTGQPKMKLTSLDVFLFILSALLGTILSGDAGRTTGERKCVSRGSGGGGTVGELAPSLLTAPWRKELLILAGDVETNPGPFTFYGELRESDLELVVEELRGVEEKWRLIWRKLDEFGLMGVDDIRYPDSTDCLREVVRRRLQGYTTTTWRTIIVALRNAGEPQVADNLKAKYIPDLLEESDLDLLTQELTGVKQKWYKIGVDLENKNKVNDIRRQYSDPDVCLRESLKFELQHSAPTTWRNIVDALRSRDVSESQLADQLEAKYCPKTQVRVMFDYTAQQPDELSIKVGEMLEVLSKEVEEGWWKAWKGDQVGLIPSNFTEVLPQKPLPTNPGAQKILKEALEKGYVECHIWKVLVTGAAGSGKTTLKYRLFGEEPPSFRCSTALAEAAIRAISREIVGTDETGWFRVTPDELMGMLGEALKAGVPMDRSQTLSSGAPQVATQKQPGNSSFGMQLKTTHGTVGNSPLPTSKATSVSPHVASVHVSQTSTSSQVSSSKQQLVQLVEKSKGSKRFLELQWIHFVDSGGQPQFHDVLPAFIRNTTTTIFVMKLSERLDEHPVIEYYDRRGELCGKPYSYALTNDQMLQCCIRTIHSHPSTREGKHSKTLVVGTHRDLENSCSESRTEKNRKLIDMLTSFQDQLVYYHLGSEVIFPINAKNPNRLDHLVCAMIRKQVEDEKCVPPPYKIPIGWFLLEQDIIKATKGGVISRLECVGIAAVLNIDAKALRAALEYFDDLNIFLYYPSVLPDIVFSNPQVILDKVTELVHFSYCLQGSSPPVALEGKWLQFRDKGIVTLEMFQDERFSTHYIQDLFTPADLIKLFGHLLIVAPLSSTKYFMPSLLRTISLEKVRKQLPLPSITVAPLLIYFPAGCARNGVFCALVVYLLTKCQWKFAKGVPECVSRSCVHLQLPDKPVSIALVDSFTFFKVRVKAPDPMYPKVCPKIREDLFNGVEAAAKSLRYNNSTPVTGFFCKCSSPPHAATPAIEDGYLMCTKSTNYGPLTEQHSVWLNTNMSTTTATEDEFAGLSHAPKITDFMNEIAVKLPDKWQDIGRGLGLQEFELKQIQEEHGWQRSTNVFYSSVFNKWYSGKNSPFTWEQVLKVLYQPAVGGNRVADELKKKFRR